MITAFAGFGGHVVDHGLEAAGFVEDFELAVGSGPALEHGVDVLDLLAAAQLVEHVVNEGELSKDEILSPKRFYELWLVLTKTSVPQLYSESGHHFQALLVHKGEQLERGSLGMLFPTLPLADQTGRDV